MSATGDPRDGGFTLLEMLVVLAILGLIGGIVYPGIDHAISAQRFRGALATATTAIRQARGRSLAGAATVRLSVADGGSQLMIDQTAPVRLPRDVLVSVTPRAGIVFYGDGSSTGGSVAIAGEKRAVRLIVAPSTGLLAATRG